MRHYQRELPHWDLDDGGSCYFVTWRLARGQLPLSAAERDVVVDTVRHFDASRYELHAFVVMDDHVHVMFVPAPAWRLSDLTHGWKSFSAHRLTREFRRLAPVWQDESFDRVVRGGGEMRSLVEYVVGNPWKRWPETAEYRWVWPRF